MFIQAKDAFDSVCAKVAAIYEKDGWKYSKSQHWMTKKDKNVIYKVFFYTSWNNVSGQNVAFYGEFAMFTAKMKNQFFYIGTQKSNVPEGEPWWNVATEDTWETTISEFTKWLDAVCMPIMEECTNNLNGFLGKVIEQGVFYDSGYSVDIPVLLEFGFGDLAKKSALKYYEGLKAEDKVAFKANYESMIHGGAAVSKFGERKMFRDIIENQIMIDL